MDRIDRTLTWTLPPTASVAIVAGYTGHTGIAATAAVWMAVALVGTVLTGGPGDAW